MHTSYYLREDELNEGFLTSVKSLFKNKRLYITIAEEMDETEYLLSNPANANRLLNSIEQAKEGKVIIFNDLKELQNKLVP